MKTLLLKFVLGSSFRMGLSYTHQAIVAILAALRGVLDHGNISDDARSKIHVVIDALNAVKDFLVKVMALVGAAKLSTSSIGPELEDVSQKLRRITEGL